METRTSELERLRQLYGEMGDEHLLDLSDDREDLTQEARLALEQELMKRNLGARPQVQQQEDTLPAATPKVERGDGFGVGIPGVVPGAAAAVEEALEPNGARRAGMIRLISFYDGMQLSQGCTALEDADVDPAIEQSVGDATVGDPTSYQIWVDEADLEAAKAALRSAMGLFPLAEGAEIGDAEANAEVQGGVVATFELESEGEAVRALVVQAGFAATLETLGPTACEGDRWVNVKVPPADGAQAVEFLERRMELES